MNSDFKDLCYITGINDYLNYRNHPPKWADKMDKQHWYEGYNKARDACRHIKTY